MHGEFYEAADGARKCKWLAAPGEVFDSLEDLVRDGPARASIEALTDGAILPIPYRAWNSSPQNSVVLRSVLVPYEPEEA